MKNTKFLKILVYGLVIFLPSTSSASGSFSLSPAKVEVSINPGQTIERDLKIVNNLGRQANFQISIQDIAPSGDEKNPINLLGPELGPYSLKNYLKPEVGDFALRDKESRVISIKIVIPKDTPPSGLYGAVTVSTYAASSSEANARIVSSLGALYFVKINGPVREVGQLTDFRLRPGRIILGDKKSTFEIIFRNEGNIYLNPYGFIGVKKWGRGEPVKLDVKPWFVLPASSRLREIPIAGELSSGLYRADLFQNRGYNDVIDTKSIWFVKLSVLTASILILCSLVLVYFIYRLVKNLFRSA